MAEPEKKVIRPSNIGWWIGGSLVITLLFIGLFLLMRKKKVNIANKVNRNITNLIRKHN